MFKIANIMFYSEKISATGGLMRTVQTEFHRWQIHTPELFLLFLLFFSFAKF